MPHAHTPYQTDCKIPYHPGVYCNYANRFRLPAVKRLGADAVLAAQFRRAEAGLRLFQNTHHLFFAKSTLSQGLILLAWPERASVAGELSFTLDQFQGSRSWRSDHEESRW
jgi:hypothetical protein